MEDISAFKQKIKKLKENFIEGDLKHLTDLEILELVLSYTAQNKDCTEAAKKLLTHFGSLRSVMEAPKYMLIDLGITPNSAMLIKMIPQLSRVYFMDKYYNPNDKNNNYKLEEKIYSSFMGCEGEQVLLILLDSKGREIYFHVISRGSVNASEIYIRKIIDICIRHHAFEVCLAHNHPSGVSFPSQKDIDATIKVKDALRAVNIKLKDHFVVGSTEAFSMAKSAHFSHIFK